MSEPLSGVRGGDAASWLRRAEEAVVAEDPEPDVPDIEDSLSSLHLNERLFVRLSKWPYYKAKRVRRDGDRISIDDVGEGVILDSRTTNEFNYEIALVMQSGNANVAVDLRCLKKATFANLTCVGSKARANRFAAAGHAAVWRSMPSEGAMEDKGPASEALATRVEGWVQYCEYFHLLDADMQRMSEVSAQRYSAAGVREGECRVRATDHKKCFEGIATKFIGRDRPLVEIEGESPDGSDGGVILDDGSGTAAGRRVLREADLTLVRSKLRAAAYSSNLRVAAEEQLAGGLRPEQSLTLSGMAPPRGNKSKAPSPSDLSTCAAAIETLLWFGLALGENSSRSGGSEGKTKCRGSIPLSECGGLDDFNLDCAQAMFEAGLTDETAADEALAAVRAVQQSTAVVPKLETSASMEPFAPHGKRPAPLAASVAAFDAPGVARPSPDARASPGRISGVHSLQRFVSSSTDSTVDGACYSDFDDEMVPDAAELDAYADFDGSAHSPSRKTASPVSTLAADSPDRKCRRSVRPLRPNQRAWSTAGLPISQWEKEQQGKGVAGKRRAAGITYAPPSRQQLGDDAYSDTASEAGSSTGSHSTINMDSADGRMSEHGDDKPLLHTFSSPKRQRVPC